MLWLPSWLELTYIPVVGSANIILAIIVEGFERHSDIANQRGKITLPQLFHRRIYLDVWQLSSQARDKSPAAVCWICCVVLGAVIGTNELTGLFGMAMGSVMGLFFGGTLLAERSGLALISTDKPKWARQGALACSPLAQAAFAGLHNPIDAQILPFEVRQSYLAACGHSGGKDSPDIPSVRSTRQLAFERSSFYEIARISDLINVLRFGLTQATDDDGQIDEQELAGLAQNIWQLYATDGQNCSWGEDILEDHDDDQGSGNHIRKVVRNEMQIMRAEQAQTREKLDKVLSMLETMQVAAVATDDAR